jgi:hypothetical protein
MTDSRAARILAVALSLACCLAAGAPAEAFSITQTGTSGGNPAYSIAGLVEGDHFTLSLSKTFGPDTLSATALLSILAIGTGITLIDVDLSNDSTGANRITHFGMSVRPDTLFGLVIDRGGRDDSDALRGFSTGTFPGFQHVDFCATSGSSCSGGGSGGLLPGHDDSFLLALVGPFTNGGTIDLGQFAFKFQGGADSYQLAGQPTIPNGQVPQPATLIIVGASLLVLRTASMARGRLRA